MNNRSYQDGIGKTNRKDYNKDRLTPTPAQQIMGMYIGEIMDDYDPMGMGRVWIYIAGMSNPRNDTEGFVTTAKASDVNTEINVQDYSTQVRNGWLFVSPILPFAGSSSSRQQQGGGSNSYGMWNQARRGDNVAVMFNDGDPNNGFFFGMIPPPLKYGQTPGVSGKPKHKIDSNTGEIYENTSPSANLPVKEKDISDKTKDTIEVSSDFARNITVSGLADDLFRGAGNSSSNRESPSYVTGIKTSGWDFDLEKDHKDATTGKNFIHRKNDLGGHNSVGHQITMDDHPDYQSMRMRTSKGSQIYMNDSADTPYIYIQTPTGGTWIELSDNGELNIYAEGGIHVHAEHDMDFTVDGDFNIAVGGDVDWRTKGDFTLSTDGSFRQKSHAKQEEMADTYTLKVGTSTEFDTGDETFSIKGGLIGIEANDGMAINVNEGGGLSFSSSEDLEIRTGGDMNIIVGDELSLFGHDINIIGTNIFSQATTSLNMASGGIMSMQSVNDLSMKIGGNILMDGQKLLGWEGKSWDIPKVELHVLEDQEISTTNIAAVVLPPLKANPIKPSGNQIINSQPPQYEETNAGIVPHHQPWAGRTDHSTIGGTSGSISNKPLVGIVVPFPLQTLPIKNQLNALLNGVVGAVGDAALNLFSQVFRIGASTISAKLSNDIFKINTIGDVNGNVIASLTGIFDGLSFNTSNTGEQSTNSEHGVTLNVADFVPVSDMVLSKNGLNRIIRSMSFSHFPKLNKTGTHLTIGFNIKMHAGLSIGGKLIGSELLKLINKHVNTNITPPVYITKEQGITMLKEEITRVESYVKSTITGNMTQLQFDSTIHMIMLTGLSHFLHNSITSNILGNNGFGGIINTMLNNIHIGSAVPFTIANIASNNTFNMGLPVDRTGLIAASRGSPAPSGNIINLSGLKIAEDVLNALIDGEKLLHPAIPKWTLFAIAHFESRFIKYAQNPHGAGGLFQFIPSTGVSYGISKERAKNTKMASTSPYNTYPVYDPVLNAFAGARFTNNNYKALSRDGATSIKASDLYFAHIFGLGNLGRKNGAIGFNWYIRNNPNMIASSAPWFSGISIPNSGVFFFGGDLGKPRTFKEVEVYLQNQIDGVRNFFVNTNVPNSNNTTITQSITAKGNNLHTWPIGAVDPAGTGSHSTAINNNGVQFVRASGRDISFLNPATRTVVENAAIAANIKIITHISTFRTQSEQEALRHVNKHATKVSQHSTGKAIDISISGWTDQQTFDFLTYMSTHAKDLKIGIGYGSSYSSIRIDVGYRKRTWAYAGGFGMLMDIHKTTGFFA